jgi:hypothetical protein
MNKRDVATTSSLFSFEKVSERSDRSVVSDNGCARCQQCTLQRLALQTIKPIRRITSSGLSERGYPCNQPPTI